MLIRLQNISKQYNRQWIFRNISFEFKDAKSYAIIGANGSGKSTLLSLISGQNSATEGEIIYSDNSLLIERESIFQKIAIAAPYVELIEEFTLQEMIDFHFQFCQYVVSENAASLMKTVGLEASRNKIIKNFSSGMKQRVKLGLAFFTEKPILLLDEPCTNLDQQGINLYKGLITKYAKGRLCIVGSNQSFEYDFCDQVIDISVK